MNIPKGKILETTQGGRFAKVETMGGQIFDDVLLIFPHNSMSRPKIGDDATDTNLVLLLQSINNDNIFGLPYNVLLQPELEIGEYIIGNFNKGSKLFFDKDGNISLEASDAGKISIDNTTQSLQDLITQLITVIDNLEVVDPISGDLPITAATSTALSTLQTNFDNLLE